MLKSITDLKVVQWAIDKLLPYAPNARTHTEEQVAQVAASIAEFGWTNPILVGADGTIIAGHTRLLAARKLNMTEVPVIVLDHLTPTHRRALVIADNRLALSAGWDEEMLRVELASLEEEGFDLDLVGFSDDELEAILRDPEETREGLTDEDAAPPEPERAVTVPGDVWVMGEHRLLCGDATRTGDIEKVLAGVGRGRPSAVVHLAQQVIEPPGALRDRFHEIVAQFISSFKHGVKSRCRLAAEGWSCDWDAFQRTVQAAIDPTFVTAAASTPRGSETH